LAIKFLNAWECEVTAFSSNPEKENEVTQFGAHHFLNSKDPDSLKSSVNKFDMVLVTTNLKLDWNSYLNTLRTAEQYHQWR
jgi:alcohol/geraniol dehydrogenase (NADP+)